MSLRRMPATVGPLVNSLQPRMRPTVLKPMGRGGVRRPWLARGCGV